MLSLVMPVYVPPGGEAVVERCLNSVLANTDGISRFDERVVVVNGECPAPLRYGLNAFASNLIWFPEPLGFTKAFNEGLKIATGDVIQLNSDTVVPKGWLDTLVRDSDIAGGVMCCDDNKRKMGPGIHKDRAWGACFYLPRKVIDKVGLWDETLNYRYSDQDYWIRCRKAGFDVSVTGNVQVEHVNSHAISHQMKDPAIVAAVQEERAEMHRRYGRAYFEKWLRRHPKGC